MNTNMGLIGKKLGNTQVFREDGSVSRVTVIQVGPCTVVGKRTVQRDGYSALILGFGTKREKLVNQAEGGFFKKLGVKAVRVLREFRLSEEACAKYEVGQTLKPSEVFEVGQIVDVCGRSKGRGFTGVMKRLNFSGAGSDTHGTHEYRRHGGSIGTNLTPGRTLPNMKMPGQYGSERVTVLRLSVEKVMDDEQLVLLRGAVPGPRNGLVTVQGTIKPKSASN